MHLNLKKSTAISLFSLLSLLLGTFVAIKPSSKELLADGIENYYDITTETFRYMRFQTSLRLVGANYLDDSTNVTSSKIYYFLGISLDENSWPYDNMDAIGEENIYFDIGRTDIDLFTNLRYQNEFPPYRVRGAVADFFHRFAFYGI